jgi:tripartite-type tricarboxylate transporter receptor subunit TctC
LYTEQFKQATQSKLLHVPYKGAAPALNDVIAGHVDGFFGDIPGLIGFVRSGQLKAIGIAAPRRHPLLPDVKTFDEMGVKGVDSDNWYALFTSKAVPAAEIDRINRAVRAALNNEAVRSKLSNSGAQPAPSSPAELAALLKSDAEKWARIVKAKNIKPD